MSPAGRRRRAGALLVAAQVTLSVGLLITAALLLRTISNLSAYDPGFDRRHLTAVALSYPVSATRAPWREAVRKVEEIPGVRGVAYVDYAMFTGTTATDLIMIKERPGFSSNRECYSQRVSTSYFSTLGIRLLAGRDFEPRDEPAGAGHVVIVNQAFVRLFLNGAARVGSRVAIADANPEWFEIVGVVGDVKYNSLRDESPPMIYYPNRRLASRSIMLIVNTPVSAPGPRIRQELAGVSSLIRVDRIVPYDHLIDQTLFQERLLANVATSIAVVAVLLSAVGLFSMVYYSVSRRKRELGIRLALGAQHDRVVRMLVWESLTPVFVGCAGGLTLALIGGRVIRGFLFGVAAHDPASIAAAWLTTLALAVIAAYLPARHAAGIEPVSVLRGE